MHFTVKFTPLLTATALLLLSIARSVPPATASVPSSVLLRITVRDMMFSM